MATTPCEEIRSRELVVASRVFSKIFMGGLHALVALVLLLAFVSSAHAAWYSANWQYRKKLTIDYTKVGATLSHFPVLVSLTSDSDLAAHARSDGYDILFTSSDGTTKLDHEIESYTSASGALLAWVRIPSLSNSADTDIYLYYGYASATDQQNKTGVWGDGGSNYYKGVWHLKETSGTTINDSTSNGYSGTTQGSPLLNQTGQIGPAVNLRYSSTDYIQITNEAAFDITNAITVSAWIKLTSWHQDYDVAVGKGGYTYRLQRYGSTDYLTFDVNTNSHGVQGSHGAASVADSNWHYIVGTFDGTSVRFYQDGTAATPSTFSSDTLGTSNYNLCIGMNLEETRHWDGLFDEVRISTTARSAQWISTEYNNQSNPGPGTGKFFKTLGSQEVNSDVTLAEHAAGQEADKFTSASSVTGAELFAF
ncbi:MAG TPA: DUF2341 domain-containing protein, partial [Syntrophobacteria bacterium]|nr:DUF2341 domain-containing protein [Syntrophobacteria bacterium]